MGTAILVSPAGSGSARGEGTSRGKKPGNGHAVAREEKKVLL
jgi:hypothetical protein